MKRYLVTGAAGFIGSNFVDHLFARHEPGQVKVLALDALTYAGHRESLAHHAGRKDFTFVHGDIRDAELVAQLMRDFDPDYIVNFAAESHVDRSITGPRVFVETNVLGTQTLLETARHAWQLPSGGFRQGKRFLQVGTDEVYGSLTRDYDTPRPIALESGLAALVHDRPAPVAFGSGFFTEQTPLSPRSPYSASKAAADMMVEAYAHTYGFPASITRCSNNYGPRQFPEKFIPVLIESILQGRRLPVYGQGLNVRDWLYVDDHCAAIDLVLRRGRPGQVYNIGGFNEASNLDIVHTVLSVMRQRLSMRPDAASLCAIPAADIGPALISYVTDRPGHDMRYAIHPGKIAAELGWTPATPFARGIGLTVDWYLDNRPWVAAVQAPESISECKKL